MKKSGDHYITPTLDFPKASNHESSQIRIRPLQLWHSNSKFDTFLIYQPNVIQILVMMIINRRQANALFKKMTEVERKLERANLVEFMQLLQKPTRLIFLNFLGGLARGFGIAVGLTIIASLFILFLTRLASLNLPVIGAYIAKLVKIVNYHLRMYS